MVFSQDLDPWVVKDQFLLSLMRIALHHQKFVNRWIVQTARLSIELEGESLVFTHLQGEPLIGGGRQQPLQSLEKLEKYKSGRKRHLMVALSFPKMFI